MRGHRTSFDFVEPIFSETLLSNHCAYGSFLGNACNSSTIHWQSSGRLANNKIRFRKQGEIQWTETIGRIFFIPNTLRRHYYTHLENLESDTVYEVLINGVESKTFKTLPSTIGDNDSVKILFCADVAYPNNYDKIDRLNNGLIQTLNPDIVNFAGDIGHCSWATNNGTENWAEFWDTWTKYNHSANGHTLPINAQWGNHDYNPYMSMFFPQISEGYGYTDIGDYLTILNLNSDHGVSVASQTGFIEQVLQEKNGRIVISCSHASPYSVGSLSGIRSINEQRCVAMREHWTPIFSAHDNHYFHCSGHTHVYGYSPLVTGGTEEESGLDPNGRRYFGQGSIFLTPRAAEGQEKWWVDTVDNTINAVWLMTLSANELKMESYDTDGNKVHTFSWNL